MTFDAKLVQIVRYGELIPCTSAFIDAHTPGSNQKENFTIIGGGVSESPDQHVHIQQQPGFNIGAAGQPPGCVNSLHFHTTAEVFFVLKGRWRFFWGRRGDAGEVTLEEGDLINIPTGIFRGFENTGQQYGMLMAVLGGDDAGGGVTWAPEVIEAAQAHGLVLGDNGILYDRDKNETLPAGIKPMPVLSETELATMPEPTTADLVPHFVARYWDLVALADREPITALGQHGVLKDRPGFAIDFLTKGSRTEAVQQHSRHTVLMPHKGYWRLKVNGDTTVLNPGDTCLIHPKVDYALRTAVSGEAALYRVVGTTDPAGPTQSR